jgi:hypothetical protein
MRVGIVLVVFLLQLGPSRAQQQPAQALSASPPSSRPLQPPSIPRCIPRPSAPSMPWATGRASGHGLRTSASISGSTTSRNPPAIVAGGQRQGIDYTSQIGLSADLDGQKLLGLTGFALHAAIVQLNGRNSSADFCMTTWTLGSRSLAGGRCACPPGLSPRRTGTRQRRVDIAAGRLPVGA